MKRKQPPKRERWPIVIVRWRDSIIIAQAWRWISETGSSLPQDCVSIGFLYRKDPKHIIIMPHISEEDSDEFQVHGMMAIPRSAIISIRKLSVSS